MPECSSGFPYFLQFKSEFGNKEFMVWATVSSWSCFCWLYRASSSLAAKNIISLISVLTIWWCPCVESSLVLLEEGVCYDQCIILGKALLVFALLHSIFQGQICLLLQVFPDFLLLHSAAAAAKSLQSCPTLCNPIDGNPPGSPVPGILQARTLEWVAISFSNAWKWKVKVKSLSHVWLLATP